MTPPKAQGTITLDDIRLPKDDTLDLDGETIKILAGPDPPIPFYVHEGLIHASSDFFDAALKHNWKEALEREIKLQEDDPEVFRMYLHWLYRDPLPSMLQAPVPGVEEEFMPILKAYVFGDKIRDTTFCDVVIDAIIHKTNTEV